MNDKRREYLEKREELREALCFVRQARGSLPEEMEGLMEDLQWVEESMVEVIQNYDAQENILADGGDELYSDRFEDAREFYA